MITQLIKSVENPSETEEALIREMEEVTAEDFEFEETLNEMDEEAEMKKNDLKIFGNN
jgi:hypothetical protein